MANLGMIIKATIKKHAKDYPNETDLTGYDITKEIKATSRHSHQQVYREIAKLIEEGEIERYGVPQSGRPDKAPCRLTAKAVTRERTLTMTNFARTSVCYSLIVEDIENGTQNFSDYIESMSRFERRLLKKFEAKKNPPQVTG